MFFEDEDLEITDNLKKELISILNETVSARVEYCLQHPWYKFEAGQPAGTFSIWPDTNRDDLKGTLTLEGLVDRTITTSDDKDFYAALADEFERLAKILRSA